MKQYILRVLLVTSPFFLVSSCVSEKRVEITETVVDIDAATFRSRIKESGGMVIDVRTPDEFAEAHIEGAVNIDIDSESFKQFIHQLDRNEVYYVYCRSGSRSAVAADYMREIGFRRVYNLEDGMLGWTSNKFPVVMERYTN